jgi:hypothetical protein
MRCLLAAVASPVKRAVVISVQLPVFERAHWLP